ncbi:Transcription factor MADS-box [Arabidopsis suecica]|uniref:Transcription factor MADS-box n=1 Tax=Arabidopsis suecica TaxID=45249 RepID=A0A8T1XSX4_ARASU|nr:Transcription factor MADS-box [Arabidopsis suecica]
MVKKGGTRRKIEIKKITKKTSLMPICTKRREGLFSKASQLCLLSGAQIAILATPPSSESNVSFYSFGHSSVDAVVSAFLSGQRPVSAPVLEDNKEMREDVGVCLTRKNLGLGFWWNNESLARSENPQELSDAIDSMWTLLSNLKELRAEEALVSNQAFVSDHEDLKNNVKSIIVSDHGTHDQTLDLQSTSAICCIPDELPENFNEISQEPDHQTLNLQSSTSAICCVPDESPANFNEITEEHDQILSICESFCVTDNNNNALTEVNLDYDQDMDNNNNNALPEGNLDNDLEMDIDQLIDFETNFESSLDHWFSDNTHQELQETTTATLLINSEAIVDDHVSVDPNLFSDFEGLEDSNLVFQKCLYGDDLRFSDFFHDFANTIAAI